MSGLPLAQAAITVDGRCRERSPADVAIFGSYGDRFVTRFVTAAAGQELLASATQNGVAEGTASLHSPAGEAPFRVSLWRQRGGDRIRLLGAFAAIGGAAPEPEPSSSDVSRVTRALAMALDSPLGAVFASAERLRDRAQGLEQDDLSALATDMLAAGWRLRRLSDDLQRYGDGGSPLPCVLGEIETGRFLRRLIRLAERGLAEAGVRVVGDPTVPASGDGPVLIADEGLLWSAIDILLLDAAASVGQGGVLRIVLDWRSGGDLTIGLACTGARSTKAVEPEAWQRARQLLEATGGHLEVSSAPHDPVLIRFAKRRVLSPD
ncbi:MAG: hypothetical protein AAFU49_20665 [Pseudomonadota bacterium]